MTNIQDLQKALKMTASKPVSKQMGFLRISARKVQLKDGIFWQVEQFKNNQAFHKNIAEREFLQWYQQNIQPNYKQVCFVGENWSVTYLYSNGKCKRLQQSGGLSKQNLSANRQKNYILQEGQNIPAFVDLGVFTKDFKIVQSKYDKFRQINRFIEIVDDAFKTYNKKSITILDFGCGKSYLTFFIYYYFVVVKGVEAKIIGYDLKADVVEHCNQIAQKYGYTGLKFVVSDVTKDNLEGTDIDMVVSLHACDVATDYALYYAISKGVKHVFSVPCCQHEINLSIQKGGELDCLLNYGIIKERVSALLTDSIRAMLLEDCGYSVDVLEFVDLAHSPKNLMLRCCKTKQPSAKNTPKIKQLMEQYHFEQRLFVLLNK